jgi:hypothetical protein
MLGFSLASRLISLCRASATRIRNSEDTRAYVVIHSRRTLLSSAAACPATAEEKAIGPNPVRENLACFLALLLRVSQSGQVVKKIEAIIDRAFPLERFFEVFDSRFAVGVKL